MAPDRSWLTVKDDGIVLAVRLTPKSGCDSVVGIESGPDGPCLRARVRAIPEKGKANTALLRLIASWLGAARSTVTLKAGSKSRHKLVAIEGEPDELQNRLKELLEFKKD